MPFRTGFGIIVVSLLLSVVAQPSIAGSLPLNCKEALLEEAKQQNWDYPYAARPGGYCDGRVFMPHAGKLELLSVTLGAIPVGQSADSFLSVSLPPAVTSQIGQDQSVDLTAFDVRPGSSWRLDGIVPAGGLKIDRQPAMQPMKVETEDLGLLATSMMNGKTVLVPLVIGGAQPDQLNLIVRCPVPLAVVQLDITDVQSEKPLFEPRIVAKNVPANEILHIQLPKIPDHPVVQVTVSGASSGSEILSISNRILMPASQ